MPELPDILVYVEALERRVLDRRLLRLRINSPFVLRSAGVAPAELEGRMVTGLRRMGKRIVIAVDDDFAAVIHLMIAGRLHWKSPGAPLSRRGGLAAFDFAEGSLLLTEAGTKHRASLHLVRGAEGVAALDPGGLELASATLPQFKDALTRESHTVKRTLTDPNVFSARHRAVALSLGVEGRPPAPESQGPGFWVRNRSSHSSSDRGQSVLSRRDSARSARSFPPVWQRGQ